MTIEPFASVLKTEPREPSAKYVGVEIGLVRIGDHPLKPGDVVREPPELVTELLQRSDFQPE